MIAIFEGGPWDGRESLGVSDSATVIKVHKFPPTPAPKRIRQWTEVVPTIVHEYRLSNDVGSVGRFVYVGVVDDAE